MKSNTLLGLGIAGVVAMGVTAQALPQQSSQRRVTVQGCLERDFLYSPSAAAVTSAGTSVSSPTPFKLTQVDIIKDEPISTGGTTGTMGAAAATPAAGAETKDKNVELHVAPATEGRVDLDGQVNHKVELVGTMTSKDLTMARGSGTATGATNAQRQDFLKTATLMFKATSVRSISDKCQ